MRCVIFGWLAGGALLAPPAVGCCARASGPVTLLEGKFTPVTGVMR